MDSAVQFPTPTRVHIGLTVSDLARSLAFYEALLGAAPVKVRPGYAKFETADPALNLSLNEEAGFVRRGGSADHFGIQVKSTDAVNAWSQRMAGFAQQPEEGTTCCYAVQDKVWIDDPDGHPWEVFVVTQADVPFRTPVEAGEARDCGCAPTCCT